MAEKTLVHEQHRTLKGQLVVPMDHPRTFDYRHVDCNAISGAIYPITGSTSGKVVYIKEMLVSELSGNSDCRFWLQNLSGHIIPPLYVKANTTVSWEPRPAAVGPIKDTIYYETEAGHRLYGEATIVVQVDPQATE